MFAFNEIPSGQWLKYHITYQHEIHSHDGSRTVISIDGGNHHFITLSNVQFNGLIQLDRPLEATESE